MSESDKTRMRAVSQDVAGGPDVLHLVEVERPSPGPVEVLVRVMATGVNPTDWKTRARGRFTAGDIPPYILGFDVSGVVAEVGAGVTLLRPGDEVFGMPLFPRPARAYAEYVVTPTRHLVRKPADLSHVEAAAIPLAGLTAWQALVDTAGLQADQRVLIHAAAGGVGHLAVQIAKARGAYVIGTASAGKHDFVRALGADEVIDYRTEDFAARLRDIDVVLDTIGGDYGNHYGTRSLTTMRPGGTLVALRGLDEQFPHEQAATRNVRAVHLLVEPDQAGMLALRELVLAGRLKAHVDAVFPLAEAAKAHEYGQHGHLAGKLVLSLTE